MVEKPAHGFEPKVEWQRQRITGYVECLISFGDDILRLSKQFSGTRIARVMGCFLREFVVCNVVFKDLVDDVDVGQSSLCVLAGQLQMGQVRPTFDKSLIRFLYWYSGPS